MAQAVGYTCDYCSHFEVARKAGTDGHLLFPKGWIRVVTHANDFDYSENKKGPNEHIEVCSDSCLAMLGIMRYEAENDGKMFRRTDGKVAGKPKMSDPADCPLCHKTMSTRQVLSSHLRLQHDTSIKKLLAEGMTV